MKDFNHYGRKTLILIGNDKIGRHAFLKISNVELDLSNFDFALDSSRNIFSIYKLIFNRRISVQCFLKMAFSELIRKNYPPIENNYLIRSDKDLYKLLRENRYGQVILFRGGLIVKKRNLSLGISFLNIHCANIPEYGGLCSIHKALKDGALNQRCCLHTVTVKIDDPSEILDTEPYTLKPEKSYFWNEEIAYTAGIELLMRFIANAQ